jgi:hypothetical protein
MKSSPIYNKSQHYLIEHASIWIFLTLICVNGTRKDNEERNERERDVTNQQHKNTNIDTIKDIFRIFLRSSEEENNLKRELIKLIT